MAFTKKPTGPPVFDAAAFTKALANGVKISAKTAAQYIEWKQWVESTDNFDGGGLRDILNANALAVDSLKANVDANSARLDHQAGRLDAVEAYQASQPRPFP